MYSTKDYFACGYSYICKHGISLKKSIKSELPLKTIKQVMANKCIKFYTTVRLEDSKPLMYPQTFKKGSKTINLKSINFKTYFMILHIMLCFLQKTFLFKNLQLLYPNIETAY